jgi:endo-1,3(4)-beta-glucanase
LKAGLVLSLAANALRSQAYYNDLHFHYGYHVYAAAVVSHFDHDWAKKHFEHVLLLVRNYANAVEGDFFPTFRMKDWVRTSVHDIFPRIYSWMTQSLSCSVVKYDGHSWASGIAVTVLNGKNQESSSESIAAYEAVALYGSVMVSIFLAVVRECSPAFLTFFFRLRFVGLHMG